jgi:hypothetical protein
MDSEKDDSKMDSSGNSFNSSGIHNMSPNSKKETNKYVQNTNIVHEEDAMEAKSNEISHHSRIMDENEDQFSENESTYELKKKMMEPEINNTLQSGGEKEGDQKPISFKVQVNTKSPKKGSEKDRDTSQIVEKSEKSHQSQHSKSNSQLSKNSQIISQEGKLKANLSKNFDIESLQMSDSGEEDEDHHDMDQMDQEAEGDEKGNPIQPIRIPHLDENQYSEKMVSTQKNSAKKTMPLNS